MRRRSLYSRSARPRRVTPVDHEPAFDFDRKYTSFEDEGPGFWARIFASSKRLVWERDRVFYPFVFVLALILGIGGWRLFNPVPTALTQWDIDNAVKYTLSHTPPGPATATVASAKIAPSVVRVDGFLSPEHAAIIAKAERLAERGHMEKPTPAPEPKVTGGPKAQDDHPATTGSGVVIDEKGDILTNLHVIHSTDRWVVTFFDGSKSEAELVSVQPENDLAVIRAKVQPDDLKPATLASTRDLYPGDTVVAVGFPFGIGPSVSAGVVAGLGREFNDPDDKDTPKLSNLIQFDAAVNPGNSGGPLVNRDGEVVGIVTAIYNPTGQRVFAGMGFAVPIENAAKAVSENPL